MTFLAADINELALSIFGGVVALTLGVTYFASKRVSSATDFWAAGRGLTGAQNGSRSPATTCRRRRSWGSPA